MDANPDTTVISATVPPPKAASAGSPVAIPGYDTLGWGFNAFDLNASQLAQSAFRGALVQFLGPAGGDFMRLTAPYQMDVGGRWTVPAANSGGTEPLTGSVYQVPADVEVRYVGETTHGQNTFYTYQQIADYFSVQAGVEGGDGLFWGSANSTFSSQNFESSSYFYGLYETFVQRWAINLDNALLNAPAAANGSKWDVTFTGDAATLTAPFDPTDSRCVAAYQDFFTRYGTHVIAGVTVGARSRISTCIKRSTTSAKTTRPSISRPSTTASPDRSTPRPRTRTATTRTITPAVSSPWAAIRKRRRSPPAIPPGTLAADRHISSNGWRPPTPTLQRSWSLWSGYGTWACSSRGSRPP